MAIFDYLSKLSELRTEIATTLNSKGIIVPQDADLSTLVPKIKEITGDVISGGFDKVLYSFGVLSDVHILDTSYDSYYTGEARCRNALVQYQNALAFYKNSGADFVCVSGDIVAKNNSVNNGQTSEQQMSEWTSELIMFANANSSYFNDGEKKVYATTGNHDGLITLDNNGTDDGTHGLSTIITNYGEGTKTAREVWNEIIGSPTSFIFEKENDVFMFLAEDFWNYVKPITWSGASWLNEKLELYKEKRVFLFFHIPLTNTFDTGGGMDGASTTGASIKNAVSKYPNVIWFSGHTHYDLSIETQEGYDNPNIFQKDDSMTMVHVPSCAYLRVKTPSGGHDNADGSQGLWVDVYSNKVVIKGIDFMLGRFIKNVDYVINTN